MSKVLFRDQGLTLEIEREIAPPRAAVWRCWTEPALLRQWYCPKPWTVQEADFNLVPGGRMNTVMQGPDGTRVENEGVWLEIVAGERLVFTDAYREGFVPREASFMTGYVGLSDTADGGTRMVWGARHGNAADKQKHLEMGFEPGWTAAAAQLAELATTLTDDGSAPSAMPFSAKVRTCLFLKDQAEEAAQLYVSVVGDSAIERVYRPDPGGPPMVVEFRLAGVPFMALDGNREPTSSELASISVLTRDQAETDRMWSTLLADGGAASRCGWLKDRFGVHWQIVPTALPRLMHSGDAAAARRVTQALMQMQKIDIAALERAVNNR